MDMGPRSGLKLAKPERRARTKARKERVRVKGVHEVRIYVMARDRFICRICRLRVATEMHELRFRSLGGKVSRQNSIAVCQGCHQFAQRNAISYDMLGNGAESDVTFTAQTVPAAEWLRVRVGESIESAPMVTVEAAE